MHWILQNDIFSETGWDTMVSTLERFGISHSVHKVIPFIGELIPAPVLDHTSVICFGTYSMRHVAKRNGWTPGVFDLFDHDFNRQLERWGEHLLNARSVVAPFQDARFPEELMFVRPTTDSKCFAGRVFSREEFTQWQHDVCALNLDDGSSLTPKTEVQLAHPVVIHAEYRYWIVKGNLVTRSLYKRGSRVIASSEVDERVDRFVAARVAEWQPNEAFVIDVCDTEEGLKIVEINTLNAAGFYAADLQKLVLSLNETFG
jgi:hypothetical protein